MPIGTPILDVGYASDEVARERWRADLASAGPAFCDTAERHGLGTAARLRVRAPETDASHDCAELEASGAR